MKNFIKTIVIASSLFIGSIVQAQEKETTILRVDAKTAALLRELAKSNKDVKITFDGSSKEWMIVKRGKKKAAALAKAEAKKKERLNRLTLLGGAGTHGLKSSSNGDKVTVQERTRPVFGFSLSRKLDDRFSLSGTVLSNETVLLGLGLDY